MKQTTSRVASRQFHQWLIPEKTVMGIFSLGVLFVFAGAVLVAIAGISSGALAIIGAILLAVGFILLLICTCLCAHAWCVWYVRDAETQTVQTSVVSVDQVDGDWNQGYGHTEVKVPNGVLRDGRQSTSSTKKHVTISPKSKDIYDSGRGDYSSRMGRKSGPSSVASDTPSTLASLSYLTDPSYSTPYSSLNQKRQYQVQGQGGYDQGHGSLSQGQSGFSQSGFSGQSSGYGSAPRQQGEYGRTVQVRPYYTDQGSMMRQNVMPVRRHSDDDYDNASDMQPMLATQSFPQAPTPQPWQQPPPMTSWQQSNQQRQGWQQQQQQQQIQQHQNRQQQQQSNQQNWRQMNISYDEPPPAQPLVYPSARRPMTFEQISSSKVSLYDNIHMNRRDDDE